VLKRQFVEHCKDHLEIEKRDHRARLRGHWARVAARGARASVDSDTESYDTQASLLREVDETITQLRKAKKELQDAEERKFRAYQRLQYVLSEIDSYDLFRLK
jgi:hypothetical protein